MSVMVVDASVAAKWFLPKLRYLSADLLPDGVSNRSEIVYKETKMNTLLSFTSADVERYKRLRVAATYLNQQLVKTVPREAMYEVGKAIGILRHGKLYFETEDMSCVLMDCCIHDWVKNGKTVVERFAETQTFSAGTDEHYLLQTYLKSEYRVLIPKDLVPNMGIQCWDSLAQEDIFIMDLGLSQSRSTNELPALATRTISLGDYWMTGGAALPTDSSVIAAALKMHNHKELMSASVLESSKMPLAIIRASLKCGMAERVRYENLPGSFQRASGSHSSPQPRNFLSRNSSCPCGSGKRYKRCCGE